MNSLLDTTLPAPPPPAIPGGMPAPAVAPVQPAESAAAPPDTFTWACPCCQATLRTVANATRGACPACGSIIEAPTSAPPPPPTGTSPLPVWKRRPCRRSLIKAGLMLFLAVGGALLVQYRPWSRLIDGLTHAHDLSPPTPEALRGKLQRFLEAPNWAAKRGLVLDPVRLDRAGSAYYNGRDPEEIQASDFQPWSMPGLERVDGVTVLRAERPGRRPVIAIFRQNDSEWHLDWEMFTQSYDEALPSFLASPSYPIRTFRARLSRVFPETANPETCAIQLTDVLDSGQSLTIELPNGTPIMRAVAGGLAGSTPRDATVEVCWARPDPDGPWVPLIQKLVCWGWQGLNGLPAKPAPAAAPNDRFIAPPTAPLSSPPPQTELALATTSAQASP